MCATLQTSAALSMFFFRRWLRALSYRTATEVTPQLPTGGDVSPHTPDAVGGVICCRKTMADGGLEASLYSSSGNTASTQNRVTNSRNDGAISTGPSSYVSQSMKRRCPLSKSIQMSFPL